MTIDWVEFAGLVVGVITAAAGLWLRFETRFRGNENSLSDYKLHVAENYTTKANLSEVSDRIMDAIAGVQGTVDQMRDRIDRAFDKAPPRSRSGG